MVTILLDSSNTDLYVGLLQDGDVLDSTFYACWQLQSEHMIVELDKLLNKHNISKEMISDIVVGNGPGSYTGVRIAVTIAKTMAVALKCNLYLVSSLRILANYSKPSICLINARSDRSYIGVYDGSNIVIEDQIMSNDNVLKYISEHSGFEVCGDTKYLGITGFKCNPSSQIASLKPCLQACNPLEAKPVYMKD